MASKKIIAIIGATGNQGGALLRSIIREGAKGQFAARAITRDLTSERAKVVKQVGAEVVQADVNDEKTLTAAIKGCYGMYCVTPGDFGSPENEQRQVQNMASAAKAAGIQHVIWSTLEDTRKFIPLESTAIPTLMDKYKVPQFDVKGESDQYFANLPTTYMLTSFFWENFKSFLKPVRGPDGKFYIALPMGKKPLPGVAISDIGKCALNIFKRPNDYINKRIGIAGDSLPIAEMAAKMTKALHKDIGYYEVSFDSYRRLSFPGAQDIANMFQFWHDYNEKYSAARNVAECRKLYPDLSNFDQWLEKNVPVKQQKKTTKKHGHGCCNKHGCNNVWE